MRVQIYTNDREQPIDLTVKEIRTKVRGIRTNENEPSGDLPLDQTVREIIKGSKTEASANLLFTTYDGREGAIYLDTDKVAAVVTSWSDLPDQEG